MTVIFLTSGTSWIVPADWNSTNNTVEVVGGGGGAALAISNVQYGAGGGGGAYSKISNLALTPGGNVTYQVGAGGGLGASGVNGGAGSDSWFNGATFGASSVGAKGGGGGQFGGTPSYTSLGGPGGAAASGIGTVTFSGGSGAPVGTPSSNDAAGGAAAGPNGNGGNGGLGAVNSTTQGGGGGGGADGGGNGNGYSGSSGGAGGSGANGGGNGGSGGNANGASSPTNGGNGTEWTATTGGTAGSGGGGGSGEGGTVAGGNGGLYGGGGGSPYGGTGGAGAQGIVVITYTPIVPRNQASGAYGRIGYGRGGYARGMVVQSGSSGVTVTGDATASVETAATATVDAISRDEALAAQRRYSSGAYPTVNGTSSLASGMVGAYFPGYGVPVLDATNNGPALVTHGVGATAGTLVNLTGFGPAMQFDGINNGLWGIGSNTPLSVAQYTMAMVVDVNGPCHQYGAGFGLAQSTDTTGNNRQHIGLFTTTDSTGFGHFVANGAQASNTASTQALPTGLTVLLLTVDLAGGTTKLYGNGTLLNSALTGASAIAWDTVSLGCRPTSLRSSPFTLNGTTTMTGTGNEDIVVGAPVADTDYLVPAGTIVTAYDLSSTYTLSQAATGSASGDTVVFGPPLTKLANMTLGCGVMWNRILTSGEIASFSANPMSAFLPGAGEGDPLFEIISGLGGDTKALAEWPAGLRRDNSEPLENTGAVRLISDELLPLEAPERLLRDASPLIEYQAAQRRDVAVVADALTIQNSNAPAWREALTKALREAGVPVENTGAIIVTIDQVFTIELVAVRRADLGTTVAWQATVAIDRYAPAEFLGASIGNITADAGLILEWLAQAKADRGLPAESGANVRGDTTLGAEALARAWLDILGQIESLSIGTIGLSSDSSLPIELTTHIPADNGFRGEWTISVSLTIDAQLLAEIGNETPGPRPAIHQVSGIRIRLLRGEI
jgi:hypothetical protein